MGAEAPHILTVDEVGGKTDCFASPNIKVILSEARNDRIGCHCEEQASHKHPYDFENTKITAAKATKQSGSSEKATDEVGGTLLVFDHLEEKMAVTTKKTIDDFFKNKRIAVIGASRNTHKYGRMLFDELKHKGYDVVPVNPNAGEISGVKAYKSIKDVKPPVGAVIAVVPHGEQEKVVQETSDAGVKMIWIHEHITKGVSNPEAIALAANKGMVCITGYCPMMLIPGTAFFHKMHGAVLKLLGKYPK